MHAAVRGVSHVSGCREADADLDMAFPCWVRGGRYSVSACIGGWTVDSIYSVSFPALGDGLH